MSQSSYSKQKREEIVTLPPCQGVKTATSLSVSVIVPSILEEWLFMLVSCGGAIEPCHQLIKVSRRFMTVDVRRRRSTACLKLTVEEVAQVGNRDVVAYMAKALSEQVWV